MLNLLSSAPAIAARTKIRQHPHMQGALVRVFALGRAGRPYEDAFRSAMLASVEPGDCIWDVGANVGFYSELFLAATGPTGTVISVEPSPGCIAILDEKRRQSPVGGSWKVVQAALSDQDGKAWLSLGAGDTAPSNRLSNHEEASTVEVETIRGDSMLATGFPAPEVIKIDVEGFEGEVLDGMGQILGHPSLRALCIEVHFAALTERGKPNEPSRIARMLESHAFKIDWTDISHLVARR